MDDHALVQKIVAGDTAQFEVLVRQFEKRIFTLALRYTRNEADAMDLSQEIFIKIYKNLGAFQEKGKLSTWIYRIATNACLDFVRKESRHTVVPLIEQDGEGNQTVMEIADHSAEPEALFLRKEQTDAVARALEYLSPDYKQMIILRDVQGLSYEEIGDMLELEDGTVKSRIFRARDALRKVLLAQNGNLFSRYASNAVDPKKGGGV